MGILSIWTRIKTEKQYNETNLRYADGFGHARCDSHRIFLCCWDSVNSAFHLQFNYVGKGEIMTDLKLKIIKWIIEKVLPEYHLKRKGHRKERVKDA
jgi:hypothetical protein